MYCQNTKSRSGVCSANAGSCWLDTEYKNIKGRVCKYGLQLSDFTFNILAKTLTAYPNLLLKWLPKVLKNVGFH